jgi:hypothetical protein
MATSSTAPDVYTPAPKPRIRTDVAKNQCTSGIMAPEPAAAWAGDWSGELIGHYCDSPLGHQDQRHGCGCGFQWDHTYRRLNAVKQETMQWDNVSVCGYCLGHAGRTERGWVHLYDGQRVIVGGPGDHASAAHNRAGTLINPADLEQLIDPREVNGDVVCGVMAGSCVCALSPGHNSPVHACGRPECGGTWTGSEPNFHGLRLPGGSEPQPVTMLVLVPGKPPEIHRMSPDLATLRALVGGWLEAIELDHGAHMYVNEEPYTTPGGLPANVGASLLVGQQRPGFLRARGLVGTAVVLGSTRGGEEADCPEKILALYRVTPTKTDIHEQSGSGNAP